MRPRAVLCMGWISGVSPQSGGRLIQTGSLRSSTCVALRSVESERRATRSRGFGVRPNRRAAEPARFGSVWTTRVSAVGVESAAEIDAHAIRLRVTRGGSGLRRCCGAPSFTFRPPEDASRVSVTGGWGGSAPRRSPRMPRLVVESIGTGCWAWFGRHRRSAAGAECAAARSNDGTRVHLSEWVRLSVQNVNSNTDATELAKHC